LVGALRWARRSGGLAGKRLLVILPDSGSRYLGKVYDDDWMRAHDLLDEPSSAAVTTEAGHVAGH
jgi:cystathionine beta-synthase